MSELWGVACCGAASVASLPGAGAVPPRASPGGIADEGDRDPLQRPARPRLRRRGDQLESGHDRRRGRDRRGAHGHRRDRPECVGRACVHRGAGDAHDGSRARRDADRHGSDRSGRVLAGAVCRHGDDGAPRGAGACARGDRHRALGHRRAGGRGAGLAAARECARGGRARAVRVAAAQCGLRLAGLRGHALGSSDRSACAWLPRRQAGAADLRAVSPQWPLDPG